MRRVVIAVLTVVAACAEATKQGATPSSVDRSTDDPRADFARAQCDLDMALGVSTSPDPGVAPQVFVDPGTQAPRPAVQPTPRPAVPEGTRCAAACQALASLERAAAHLCALSDPTECADAKSRVEQARDRVVKACGACKPTG
jgi:hypothetical protein